MRLGGVGDSGGTEARLVHLDFCCGWLPSRLLWEFSHFGRCSGVSAHPFRRCPIVFNPTTPSELDAFGHLSTDN
jgi:hypothetical protein